MITVLKELDNTEYNITLKSDGIVYVMFKKDFVLDIPKQLEMLAHYDSFTEKKLTPFLFEAEEGVIVTKEARENAILIEEQSPISATALIVNSIAYAMIGNFYMKINKPKRPFKVFKYRTDGLSWLQQYL